MLERPSTWYRVAAGLLLSSLLVACGGGGDSAGTTGGASPTASPTYTLGGSVSGLSGVGLQLKSNAGTPFSVSANGSFSFPTSLTSGTAYAISIASQPTGPVQTCVVNNGTGTVSGSNVANVSVACTTNTYTVGGTLSGLSGQGLVLQQGSDMLPIAADGSFSFPTPVQSGAAYAVSIAAQPSGPSQACQIGSGMGTVAAAAISNVTITCGSILSADNAASVTEKANGSSETIMQLASFLGERLTWLSGHLAPTATESCSDPYGEFSGGQAAYSFTDSDASGSLTAGDVVTINLSGCLSNSMADIVSGTVTLTLLAPTSVTAQGLVFAATANLNPVSLTGLQVNGSLNAQYVAAETVRSVRAAGNGLQLNYTTGGWFAPDNVIVMNFDISKAIDYTVPRYSVLITSTFQSPALGGVFSITSPTALGGRLGAYPDVGTELFEAGIGALQYSAQNIPDNEYVTASLDPQGTGTFSIPVGGLFWEQGFNGFPYWEPRGFSVVNRNSRPSYMTVPLSQWEISLLFTEPQAVDPINSILSTAFDVATPIKLFFSAPVDPNNTALVFTPASYIVGPSSIPAVLSIQGPIVTATAQTQIQHGEQWSLQSIGRIPTPWIPGGPGTGVELTFTTLNNLQANSSPSPAVAAPGQTVQLLSTGSYSTNSTISAYSWTQTAGRAVILANANSSTANFVVPSASQTGESLHFNLTITDANGETDNTPVTVFTQTDLTQPFLYYRQAQSPVVGQTPELAVLENSTDGSIRTELGGSPNIFRFVFTGAGSTPSDELQFFPGNGVIAPGTYTNANTPGGEPFFIQSIPNYCFSSGAPNWQFTIYESQAAGDGTAAVFSADFMQSCPGGNPAPYIGSVRVNSSVPLP
jgi:hypothetical protein